MSEAEGRNNKRPECQGPGPTRSFSGSALGPGGRIGPFRIERELGRGAAGVVYLAHDTKLDRSVAIKSLPAELMENPKARTRFAREARVLASLNHPNIATIYEELQEAEGVGYLILEYVPGQTLAERIAGSRLKLQEALSIAQQIAEAVAAAHEHDVIHRDLKPGNIKITPEGKVKVLDFGLAKALGGETVDQQSTVTEPGRIIGTPAYMSPEQARGQQTDKRCDIWSFGCVLYEMLTGKVPFEGETVSDTLAGILEREPDWHALPQTTPANIQVLLQHCLEKDPRRRLRDIGDAGIEISEALTRPFIVSPESRPSRYTLWKVAALCVFVGLVLGVIVMLMVMTRPTEPTGPKSVRRYPVLLDPENPITRDQGGNVPFPTFTPDGRQVIYVGGTAPDTWLVRRPLDSLHAERILGTQGATEPQVSPDGQWLAFYKDLAIWKVPLAGGKAMRISNSLSDLFAWEDDNTLILGTNIPGAEGLSRLDLRTGKTEPLTKLNTTAGETSHFPLYVDPENRTLFWVAARGVTIDELDLFALSLEGRQVKFLIKGAGGVYVPSGHLIYVQRGRVMAAPFNIKTLQITGPAVNVTEERMATNDTLASLTASRDGTLVYVPVEGGQEPKFELVWVDFEGNAQPLAAPLMFYDDVRLSNETARPPRIVTEIDYPFPLSIQVYDTGGAGPLLPLTFPSEGHCFSPVWVPPDYREVVYDCLAPDGSHLLKQKAADGSGEAKILSIKPSKWVGLAPFAFTPDGKRLVTDTWPSSTTGVDIVEIDLERDGEVRGLLASAYNEDYPALSPDGKWLAYASDESGRYEVFVTRYPDIQGKWYVSAETEGGNSPVWAPDGSAIYYRDGTSLLKVPVETEGGFKLGHAQALFKDDFGKWHFAVHPDGKRFLMRKKVQEQEQAPITELIIVENWFEELKRRVPVGQN